MLSISTQQNSKNFCCSDKEDQKMKKHRPTSGTFRSTGRKYRSLVLAATLVVGFLFIYGVVLNRSSFVAPKAMAAPEAFRGGATPEMLDFALNFGEASSYAVYGGNKVTNRGNSVFRGSVGSGGIVMNVPGVSDSAVGNGQAKRDLRNALRAIAQLPCEEIVDTQLGGKTFTPGVYCLPSADLAGTMTLDGGGDANARFIFRVAGTLTTAKDSILSLSNSATAAGVYIIANGDTTISEGTDLNANLIATGKISVDTNADISGKTLGGGDIDITEANLGNGTGTIEICKLLSAGDPIPAGTIFSFNVTGIATPVQVPAGGCSNPFDVAAGNVTISEALRANTAVVGITTNPADRRVSFNLALRQVVVNVPEGGVTDETVVTFTNQTTRTGTIEICKNALDDDVTGFFQFTVQGAPGQTFAVPTGFCSPSITVTIPQIPGTDFTANVTELARANFRLENVTTFPAGRFNTFTPNQGFDANGNPITNTNGGFANVDLIVGGGPNQQTTVNFFNRSLPGTIKVCKITADPANIPQGTSFRFTVTGTAPTSATQTTPGVAVTRTVDVLAGPDAQGGFCQFVDGTFVVGTNVTITETGLTPGSTLPGGLTFADTRVSRIRGTTPILSSNLDARTVTISARNTTAAVDFTNFVFRPAVLKICKVAGAGVTPGTNFTFTLAAANPLVTRPISTAPITVPAGSCAFANGPFPAVDAFPGIGTFNFGTSVIVTEGAAAGTVITTINSPTGGTVVNDIPNRRTTFTLNQALLPNSLFNEIAFTNASAAAPPTALAVRYDFDGDGMSDPAIYRPTDGVWWYGASSANGQPRPVRFGMSTDRVVAADYDGDHKADYAIYRDGQWHVLGTATGYWSTNFGMSIDIPQPADYDGDGKADIAVFRPSEGIWYLMMSRDGFAALRWGMQGDIPVAADFDGDGRADPAIYRGGTWYILNSNGGFRVVPFGMATDKPVPADFDGDRQTDVAVFRNGEWHILKSSNGGYVAFPFGMTGDLPVPADYNGDGVTDAAVYRPSNNVWHILRSGSLQSGSGYTSFQFGMSGDVLLNY
jgi:hypothetical protein